MNTPALLVCLCCLAVRGAAWRSSASSADRGLVLYAMAPEDRGAYYVNAESGRYNYGYNTGDGIAKVEAKQPDGSIVGSYRYFDPTGKQVIRSYVADKRGFRVLGNDLPISPDTPVSHLAGLPAFTGAVEGTEEFAIPPPVGDSTQSSHHHHLQQQQAQERALTEHQKKVYRRQQEELEGLRHQLRKLEAEQRKSYKSSSYNIYDYTLHPYQQDVSIRNHLTHGYTSPYRYFERDIDYDFPAGFAYGGLPTIVDNPARTYRYPQSPFVAGRTR